MKAAHNIRAVAREKISKSDSVFPVFWTRLRKMGGEID